MSQKRRDKRNRVLRTGESQRADGRYVFKYKDIHGTERYVYSWKLDKNDRTPSGKRNGLSLREKEEKISRDILDGLVPNGGGYTVLGLAEKYLSLKTGLRHNTVSGYNTVICKLRSDSFGNRRIDTVSQSDAKAWFIKLQKSDGMCYSSICSIKSVLSPAFEMAVEEDLVRKNPFKFGLSTVINNDAEGRGALTKEQMSAYLQFVKNDRYYSRYYDAIFLLFNTGMRISELCGLTVGDIDFKQRCINVERQLIRAADMSYYIEKPKTRSGRRKIPINDELSLCLKRIIASRPNKKLEPVICGHSGFLFLNNRGRPTLAQNWDYYMRHIMKKYNSRHNLPIPNVTPHVCRHTFCSNMARSGMNPKNLQYIMGHSNISVTLNTYTHLGFDSARDEFDRIMLENAL